MHRPSAVTRLRGPTATVVVLVIAQAPHCRLRATWRKITDIAAHANTTVGIAHFDVIVTSVTARTEPPGGLASTNAELTHLLAHRLRHNRSGAIAAQPAVVRHLTSMLTALHMHCLAARHCTASKVHRSYATHHVVDIPLTGTRSTLTLTPKQR